MLNQVLHLLEERHFFESLGRKKTMNFVKEVLEVGCEWGCADGEVLDGVGQRLGICHCCHDYHNPADFKGDSGICKVCRRE